MVVFLQVLEYEKVFITVLLRMYSHTTCTRESIDDTKELEVYDQ